MMEFSGSHRLPAPPEEVWRALNDPEALKASIPGCTALEQTGEQEFTATVTARVGPISAPFKGKVEIVDSDPPHGYTLRGRGQAGAAGFAAGEARVRLAPKDEGTELTYTATADVGGKLGSVGGRLVTGVAQKTADEFFSAFSKVVRGDHDAARRSDHSSPAAPPDAPAASDTPAAAPTQRAGHIPLIDRVAWLFVGIALGLASRLIF